MKIAKIVFLLVALSWGSNALAGKVVCGKVTDQETGTVTVQCAYVSDFEDGRIWAFKFAFFTAHRPETTYFGSYVPFFEETDVADCQDGRDYVASIQSVFMPGFGCLTGDETESLRKAIYEKLDQLHGDICPAHREGKVSADALQASVSAVTATICAIPGVVLTHKSPFMGALAGAMGAGFCGPLTWAQLESILDEHCD